MFEFMDTGFPTVSKLLIISPSVYRGNHIDFNSYLFFLYFCIFNPKNCVKLTATVDQQAQLEV